MFYKHLPTGGSQGAVQKVARNIGDIVSDSGLDFSKTEAWGFLSRAKAFLEAAEVLKTEIVTHNRITLFAPTLHNAGHGLELLLKGCLIHNGVPTADAVNYRHNVNAMWELPQVSKLREIAAINAKTTHAEALASGLYPDAATVADPAKLFEEYRHELGRLHAEAGKFPLRYPTHVDERAPRTPLLVGTLWRTADDYVKRPNEFRMI